MEDCFQIYLKIKGFFEFHYYLYSRKETEHDIVLPVVIKEKIFKCTKFFSK